jgi:hypothetical protein
MHSYIVHHATVASMHTYIHSTDLLRCQRQQHVEQVTNIQIYSVKYYKNFIKTVESSLI